MPISRARSERTPTARVPRPVRGADLDQMRAGGWGGGVGHGTSRNWI